MDCNICYTDYFDINRGNQYGKCTVQVSEALYKLIPCYYVSKNVSIKQKTNDQEIYHLEFVSYVTPKLDTLSQLLILQKGDGVSYNQHVNYDETNDNINIEQYYHESENNIKQIFKCKQYLSEGKIKIKIKIKILKLTFKYKYILN